MTIADRSAIDIKLSRLITTLIDKTQEGKVSWEDTINDDRFLAGFSRYVVSIEQGYEDDFRQTGIYRAFRLLNQDGKTIDEKVVHNIDSPDYDELGNLLASARRSAHNAEESLDTLLQELESR